MWQVADMLSEGLKLGLVHLDLESNFDTFEFEMFL